MKRDFADFWNLLWELTLGVCAMFALINVFVPPQDLPWKPLDLTRPLGAATTTKVAAFEVPRSAAPERVAASTEACMQVLRDAGVTVERAEDTNDGSFCVVNGAVRITGGAVTPLAGSPVMQCPLAVRYVLWDRQVMQPAAQAAFGSRVARVTEVGTYACRRVYGQTTTDAKPSEHARANALDIGGMTLADGRKVSVLADWNGEGPAGPEGSTFLKRIRDGACRAFGTTLSPDYNAAHANHLHLDGAIRRDATGLCD